MEASTTTPVTAQPGENWFRPLKGDRLEVCLKAEGLRLRASGPEGDVWRLVEAFEEMTGVEVQGEWLRPPRRGGRPMAGQLTMDQPKFPPPESETDGED